MDARGPRLEVMAGAVPLAGVETDVMGVVVATEGESEPVDRDPIELTRVGILLRALADQGTVHRGIPPSPRDGRSRGRARSMHQPTDGAVVCPHDTPET